MKSCWATLSMSKERKKSSERLEYNTESEVSLMCTLSIIARCHMESMNIRSPQICVSHNSSG